MRGLSSLESRLQSVRLFVGARRLRADEERTDGADYEGDGEPCLRFE
ncbi:hypothetical protein M3J09_008956 [Ascochyta lentis]